MILYISIVILLILAINLAYVIYQNVNLKARMIFLVESDAVSKAEIELLESSKIEYIQQVERLSSQIKYQEQFIEEFEKLRDESKQSTKAALFDLGNELSKQLIDIHRKETKESRDVSDKSIKEASSKFNSEFERVVNMVGSLSKEVSQSKDIVDIIKNSLLSPSGSGYLAEITLENILKSSGLRANLDYYMQYSLSTEDNTVLRPDALVFLPSNKLMVIDAKASKFLVDDQDNLKNLARTMNTHLRSLSGKNYAEIVKKSLNNKNTTSIITLMFVPSEHAVEKIIESDPDFMNKAWKANIFPVGPAGLMNMLSFAKFQISEQMMLYNHQQIIEEVKKLISSVGIMTDHSVRLGSSISNAMNYYDKFAASFNCNFLSKARNIKKMGIEAGGKKIQESLQRFQVISLNSELIDVEPENEVSEVKTLEEA